MDRAIELARVAAVQGEVPVGAVVAVDGIVVAEAHNEVERRRNATAHAELLALQRAAAAVGDRRLEHATLYVTLEPCVMCAGACVLSRIGELVFGALDPKAGGVETLYRLLSDSRLNHRVSVCGGVEAAVCSDLLSGFFRSLRGSRPEKKR
ncbi:MAG: nucleoside deaminase [Planctomycetota bacterium]